MLRIEFPGAFNHGTTRGDGHGEAQRDNLDREKWLIVLAIVAERFNW
jgi:hypothetical protein